MATTRSAHNLERTAEHTALMKGKDVPLLSFSNFHIYVQPDPQSPIRTNQDNNPDYDRVRHLARIVLSHLRGSKAAEVTMLFILNSVASQNTPAADALRLKLGSERHVDKNDIHAFLDNKTPDIVFKEFTPQPQTIVWGQVLKGALEGADANEIFLSMELLKVMRDPPPTGLAQDMIILQRARQSLLWSITFLHEVMHCITKHFFGPEIIIPKLPHLEPDANSRHGEVGLTLEKYLFGFVLEMLWTIDDAKKEDRLWYVQDVVARFGTTTRVFDGDSILKVQDSLRKDKIWRLEGSELAALPTTINANTHICYRGAGVSKPVATEEEEEEVVMDGFIIMKRACGQRGAGLGIVDINSSYPQ